MLILNDLIILREAFRLLPGPVESALTWCAGEAVSRNFASWAEAFESCEPYPGAVYVDLFVDHYNSLYIYII